MVSPERTLQSCAIFKSLRLHGILLTWVHLGIPGYCFPPLKYVMLLFRLFLKKVITTAISCALANSTILSPLSFPSPTPCFPTSFQASSFPASTCPFKSSPIHKSSPFGIPATMCPRSFQNSSFSFSSHPT